MTLRYEITVTEPETARVIWRQLRGRGPAMTSFYVACDAFPVGTRVELTVLGRVDTAVVVVGVRS